MRKLKIPVGQIHTSLFQRAIETGALMDFGDVRASADYTEGDSWLLLSRTTAVARPCAR